MGDLKYVTLDHKISHKLHRYIVAITKNTLYGSKWSIFRLCQNTRILNEDIFYSNYINY